MPRKVTIVVVALVIAALGYAGWQWFEAKPAAAQSQSQPRASTPTVPVDLAAAKRQDVPIYLHGLGTVQAFNTVTIHSRVDGELMKVAFTEGQDVKAGDVLAQIDPRPFQAALDQAVAKEAQDQAQLANAKLDLQRDIDLAKRSYATQQAVDTQNALVAQLQAMIKGDQAAIDNARVQLGYTTITSPLDGRTGIRLVDQGNIIHATDPNGLVVITQLKPISLIFTLPEENLPAISRAMAAGPLNVSALSRDGKDVLDNGTVMLVDNEIDPATGTIRIKAKFPNPELTLWPGQYVNSRLQLRTDKNVVTIPSDAVERGAQGLYTWIVKPDSTVAVQPIKVGQIDEGMAEIEDGVSTGEQVVTAGQYRLQPGTRIAAGDSKAGSDGKAGGQQAAVTDTAPGAAAAGTGTP